MTFTSELSNKEFRLNVVLSVDSVFYSRYQVDTDTTDIIGTGSKIDSNKVGIVDSVTINPTNLDIRNVRTTTQTISFTLVDKDIVVTNQVATNDSQILEKDVIVYVGFNTATGFDMADYLIVARAKLKDIRKEPNRYKFKAADVVDLMNKDMFTTFDQLDGAITAGATSLDIDDASSFPTSGTVKIDDEFIDYSGKTDNTLTGLTRGTLSSTADAHSDDSEVFLVTSSTSVNPITFMLQLMVSPGGGGAYDVLSDGLGISSSLIDVSTFESIRDNNFSTELHTFHIFDVGNGLKFLEENILLSTNTRFINKNGLISLALLDQITFDATVPDIDEDTIIGNPTWTINSDKIINKVEVRYDFVEGLNEFTRVSTFEDSDSIAAFGEKPALKLNYKYVRFGLAGANIVQNRANRILARMGTPRAEITARTLFSDVESLPGDDVLLTHRYLPATGGPLGISEQLEIMSRAIDLNTGTVKFKLNFTAYTGIRAGAIAPAPFLTGVTSQTVFTIADASCWRVGDKVRLWNSLTNTYTADAVNTITDITGTTITVQDAFTTTLVTTLILKVADYNDASSRQRGAFAFVGEASGFFDDGSKSYQILF